MFLSLTIATIASLIGSSLARSVFKEDQQETSVPTDTEKDYGHRLKEIQISHSECKAYDSLLTALSDNDLNQFKTALLDIETELCRAEILHGTESTSTIFQLLKGRLKKYCEQQNNVEQKASQFDITVLDSLRDYIEFVFLKTDKDSLDLRYTTHSIFESADSPVLVKSIDPDKITAVFKIISDANQALLKNGLGEQTYSYYDLLNHSGDVYSELVHLNSAIGYIHSENLFSDIIVSEISETILNNTNFYFCRGLTPTVFAKDLKEHIIHYLHHNQISIEQDEHKTLYALTEELDNNYFKNRTIRNYYYFLILCARFVGSLKTNWIKHRILHEIPSHDYNAFKCRARELLFDKIRKYDYAYLRGLSEDELWMHVLATKPENEDDKKKRNQ